MCWVLGLRVGTNVDPELGPFRSRVKKKKEKKDLEPDPFTYGDLNNDLDLVFNGSEPLVNRRIRDPVAFQFKASCCSLNPSC